MYNDYPVKYETQINQSILWITLLVIGIVLTITTIIALGKTYKKTNHSFISSFIPIYNIIILLEITNLPKYYFAFFLIPIFNIYIFMKTNIILAKSFKKTTLFGVGLTFLPFIFYPILGFGDSEYIGINLIAMENKSTITTVPNYIDNKEDKNIVVHEEEDKSSSNINISIGGGVYQKDYNTNLLNVDENQTVTKSVNNTPNSIEDLVKQNETIGLLYPKVVNTLDYANTVSSDNNKNIESNNIEDLFSVQKIEVTNNSEIQSSSSNIVSEPKPVVNIDDSIPNKTTENNNVPKIEIGNINSGFDSNDYITCPKCGAKVKKESEKCFLCGTSLK